MFADDTLLYNLNCKPNFPTCCAIQNDADRVSSWAKAWNTTFNASKSANIVFGRSSKQNDPVPSSTLHLNGEPIPHHASTRHLGLTLTASLHWSDHIDLLIHAVAWKLCVLKRLALFPHVFLCVHSLTSTALSFAHPWNTQAVFGTTVWLRTLIVLNAFNSLLLVPSSLLTLVLLQHHPSQSAIYSLICLGLRSPGGEGAKS